MKAAITIWNGRIAPLFDSALGVMVVDDANLADGAKMMLLPEGNPIGRVRFLANEGIDTLVCGAITRCAQATATANRIRVIGFVAGDSEEIIAALLNGSLDPENHAMPGCGMGHGRCRRRRNY